MIVPTSKTRSVRIAPKAASFWVAGSSGAGDLASPELLGAAVYPVKRPLICYQPLGSLPAAPGWRRLSPQPAPCGQCRGTGKRRAEWFDAIG